MIYLGNVATTYPKPQLVAKSIKKFGANPGRSGHNMPVATAREPINGRPFK